MLNSTNRRKLAVASQIALACYWVLLAAATHLPAGTSVLPGRIIDKIDHFFAYAVLAALIATTWQLTAGYLTARHIVWVWIAIALWGVLDELTQIPVGRTCSFWDWLADVTGAAFGLLLFTSLRRIAEKRMNPRQ